jgi:ubiquinone/menaquinone biosynthesis C-methylase UbiE
MHAQSYTFLAFKKTEDRENKARCRVYFRARDAKSIFWSDTYQRNDAHGVIVRQRQATALKYIDELSLPKTARVLEIGCGAGFLAIALTQRGFVVEAVDHAPAMIKLTQRHAEQASVDDRIRASIEDVHELSFEDESFDIIVALGVVSWLHDLKKALVEIVRVLKPGGYVVLNTGRAHALLNPLSIPAFESILERLNRKLERIVTCDPQNLARAHAYLDKEFNRYLRNVNRARAR